MMTKLALAVVACLVLAGCAAPPSPVQPATSPAPQPAAQAQALVPEAPVPGSGPFWDVRKVQCAQLLGADDDDRQAAVMFYYGYLAARSRIHVIDVSRIDQNIRRVIDQCAQTPNATVVQAYTSVFGRKLTH